MKIKVLHGIMALLLLMVSGCSERAEESVQEGFTDPEYVRVDSALRSGAVYFANGQSMQLRQMLLDLEPTMQAYRTGNAVELGLYARYLRNQLTYFAQFTTHYDSMLHYGSEAKKVALEIGDNRAAINAMSNLADILRQRGDVVGAVQEYRHAMWLNDSTEREPELYLAIHSGLGCTYIVLRNLDKAEQILLGMAKWKDCMQTIDSISYFQLLGNCYYYKKDYRRSLDCFMSLDSLLGTHPELEFDHHACQVNIADIYIQTARTSQLGSRLDEAESYFRDNHIDACLPYIHTLQIQRLLSAGMPEEARRYAKGCEADLSAMNPDHKVARYAALVSCMKACSMDAQALAYEEMRDALSDSLRSVQTRSMVDEIEQRYQFDIELARQKYQTERAKLRTAYLWVALLAMGLLTVALMLMLMWRSRKQRLEKQQAVNKILELRHEIIHNRITPHFISNALALGRNLTPEDIESIILLIRDTLKVSHHLAVTLTEELQLVEAYVSVARRISRNVIDFTADTASLTTAIQPMVPSMSLLTMVENAIKHGSPAADGTLHITLTVTQSGREVTVLVRNNGRLEQYHRSNDSAMHGLRLLSQTVLLTNQHLPSQHIDYQLRDTEDGYVESIMRIKVQ